MYLSDRDIQWAIATGKLIVQPPPEKIDSSSFDVHLDDISQAKVWNVNKFLEHETAAGERRAELRVGTYNLGKFSQRYLEPPPDYSNSTTQLVGRRGNEIVIKPFGFVLWTTVEKVGTPEIGADLICFIDGKSTRARAGIIVHLTAPTIHASWSGKIVLEIYNAGPFDLVLAPGDVIAQVVVAKITSIPEKGVQGVSATHGQIDAGGHPA